MWKSSEVSSREMRYHHYWWGWCHSITGLGNAQGTTNVINRKKKKLPPNVHGRHQTKNKKELETLI